MSVKQPFKVEKRYQIAKFDESLISPSGRPSLLTWRGMKSSVFYYTWRQAVGFICVYYIIQVIYRYCVITCRGFSSSSEVTFLFRYEIKPHEDMETKFHDLVEIWNSEVKVASKDLIFLLGFYVSMIVKRWWDQVDILLLIFTCLTCSSGL